MKLTKEEAKRRNVRALKIIRDLFLEHGKYICDKYGSSYYCMDPDEAKLNEEEIRQDLMLTTNLGEAFSFFKKSPTLYENNDLWNEIDEVAKKCSALLVSNLSNSQIIKADIIKGKDDQKYDLGEGELLKRKTDYIVSTLGDGGNPTVMFDAESILSRLETVKNQ